MTDAKTSAEYCRSVSGEWARCQLPRLNLTGSFTQGQWDQEGVQRGPLGRAEIDIFLKQEVKPTTMVVSGVSPGMEDRSLPSQIDSRWPARCDLAFGGNIFCKIFNLGQVIYWIGSSLKPRKGSSRAGP